MAENSSHRWLIVLVAAVSIVLFGSIAAVFYGISRIGTSITKGSSFKLSSNPRAVIVRIEGIIDADTAFGILEDLRSVEKNPSVKAILVRVDSPGGTVGASQEIYAALKSLKTAGRKVYCSFGDLAASGGYYVAMGCEQIFSNPGTLTGSIGVIMQFVNLKDLYAWAKVQPEVVKAGRYKDIGSETRAMRDDERALVQRLLDDTHRQFREAVLEGRPSADPKLIDEFADGRILSGQQALAYKLVDALGTIEDAKNSLLAAAGLRVDSTDFEELGPGLSPWDELFGGRPRRRRRSSEPSSSELAGEIRKLVHGAVALGFQVKPGIPYYLPSFFVE